MRVKHKIHIISIAHKSFSFDKQYFVRCEAKIYTVRLDISLLARGQFNCERNSTEESPALLANIYSYEIGSHSLKWI